MDLGNRIASCGNASWAHRHSPWLYSVRMWHTTREMEKINQRMCVYANVRSHTRAIPAKSPTFQVNVWWDKKGCDVVVAREFFNQLLHIPLLHTMCTCMNAYKWGWNILEIYTLIPSEFCWLLPGCWDSWEKRTYSSSSFSRSIFYYGKSYDSYVRTYKKIYIFFWIIFCFVTILISFIHHLR